MEIEKNDPKPETEVIETHSVPDDATDEELCKVAEAHRAGYPTYTVEILRMNRARAYAGLERIERHRKLREKKG